MKENLTALLTLFGVLIGYVMKWIGDSVDRKHKLLSEREARSFEINEKRRERRNEFQRQTLLDLQEARLKMVRALGAINHFDDMEFRRSGKWGGTLIPETLNQDSFDANRQLLLLAVRIRDSKLRELMQIFRSETAEYVTCRDRDSARALTSKTMNQSEQINLRIGELLRTLDDEEF